VGDVSAVADLYRQHGTFIHTISRELVGAAADRLTQQVFTEAWRDRLDFNPSLGTVRNWLIRRARKRVSKPSPEAAAAVDRLVVADSLNRMDELRRRVVIAGSDASDVDVLARRLDQPVATIRSHLRRGSDQLKADLAESRPDGDDEGLIEIMAGEPPTIELVTPPEVVWQAIAAELNLDTGAVTTDDFNRIDGESVEDADDDDPDAVDEVEDSGGDVADSVEGDHAQSRNGGPETDDAALEDGTADVGSADTDNHSSDIDDGAVSESAAGEDNDEEEDDQSVDRLRGEAEATDLDRPGWKAPLAFAVVFVILIVIILTAF